MSLYFCDLLTGSYGGSSQQGIAGSGSSVYAGGAGGAGPKAGAGQSLSFGNLENVNI